MKRKNKSSNHSKRENIAGSKVDRKASNKKLDDVKSGWSFGKRKNKSKSAKIEGPSMENNNNLGGIYEEVLESVVSEYRILKQIGQLKEARAAGCRSSAEAHIYLQHKNKKHQHSAANLLSESEKQVCGEMRMSATDYLKLQEDMSTHIMTGNISKKSDAYSLFQTEPAATVDRVYDMLVNKGIIGLFNNDI